MGPTLNAAAPQNRMGKQNQQLRVRFLTAFI